MLKLNKKMVIAVAAVVLFAGAASFYLFSRKGGDAQGITEVVRTGSAGYPVSMQDARVYSMIDKYLKAQVENRRSEVFAMLTAEHRSEWNDDSFLLSEKAFEIFDEITLGDIRMGVINYQAIEGQTVASILLDYSLYFLKDGQLSARTRVAEEVVLGAVGDEWLLASSVRSVAASSQY